MKNNEYNIVKVTNEKNNIDAEFTHAQNVEFSFQPENKNTLKDELNDNSTVNDKVEDNLSKKAREKEEKKEKKEAEVEGSEQLSSSSSSSAASSSGASSTASSAASSTAAASSAGATGGALGGIVAAATVSVAAIGTIVGINVIGAQEPEQVTFLSSEVTSSSIDYSFSMPSQLLRYEETVGADAQLGEKMVVATISDGLDFKEEEYLVEPQEYDENVLIFSHSFSGLTPDTAYALTLILREENPTTEVPNDTQLAYRTFRTDAVGEVVVFDNIETTANSVSFSFIVENSAIEYVPGEQQSTYIQASISGGETSIEPIWIEVVDKYDETHMKGYGEFGQLDANTTYTLTLKVDLERELKYLGSTTFTTQAKPSSGFTWGIFTLDTEGAVTFRFYAKSSYIGFVEGGPTPNCIAVVTLNGQQVISSSEIAYSTFDPEHYTDACAAEGTIDGLEGSTTYEMTIYFVDGQSEEALGDPKEFTTKASRFYFGSLDSFDYGDDFISPSIYIKNTEFEPSSTNTGIQLTLYGGMATSQSYDVLSSDLTQVEGSEYYTGKPEAFTNLDPNITYRIFATNTYSGQSYSGTIEVTTTGPETGFAIDSFTPDATSVTTEFSLSSSYATNPTGLYVRVVTPSGDQVGDDSEASLKDRTDTTASFEATFSGLTGDTSYILGYYCPDPDGGNDILLGAREFTTLVPPEPGFYGATINEYARFALHSFEITLDFVEDPDDHKYDSLAIQLYNSNYDDPNKELLGNLISLESETSKQSVDISNFSEEFGIGDIKSFEILATQEEIYHNDVAFINTDGTIDQVNSDYTVTIENSGSDKEVLFPIQIDYTDNYEVFSSGFAVTLEPTSAGTQFTGWFNLSATEDYQLAKFSEPDLISYLEGGSTEFEFTIADASNQSIVLHTATINLSIASTNNIYAGEVLNTEILSSDPALWIDLVCVYAIEATTSNDIQIIFINEADPDENEYYTYSSTLTSRISFDMTQPTSSTGETTISDFNSLANAMGGKTFKIRIEYNGGRSSIVIQEGVSFTFTEQV